MLLNLKQLLDYTNGKEFAVPAFNVYNMETVMGIMAAAEETNAPVIIQCYPFVSIWTTARAKRKL